MAGAEAIIIFVGRMAHPLIELSRFSSHHCQNRQKKLSQIFLPRKKKNLAFVQTTQIFKTISDEGQSQWQFAPVADGL
jgi:hypothetical protein